MNPPRMAHTMLKLDVERVGILAILSSYLLDACLFGIYFELNCNPAYFSARPSQAKPKPVSLKTRMLCLWSTSPIPSRWICEAFNSHLVSDSNLKPPLLHTRCAFPSLTMSLHNRPLCYPTPESSLSQSLRLNLRFNLVASLSSQACVIEPLKTFSSLDVWNLEVPATLFRGACSVDVFCQLILQKWQADYMKNAI